MTSRQNLLMIQERERKKQEEMLQKEERKRLREEKAALKRRRKYSVSLQTKAGADMVSSTAFLIPTVKGHAYF